MPPTSSQQKQIEAEFVTLRDYIDTRLDAIDREKEVAYRAMEKRLDGMNEFRDTLKDQGGTFLTKNEYCVFKESVEKDLRVLRESRAELSGKASQLSVNITLLLAIIGLILSIWARFQ